MAIPTIDDIRQAQARIRQYLPPTPMEEAVMLPPGHWLKLENANKTHSFKVRGALNAMLALDEATRARGVIAASTGNHAQGMAYAARLLGVKATIIMPETAARKKVAGVKRLGAEAVLTGASYDDAEAEAHRLEHLHGLTYISPYNDPQVVAGQGIRQRVTAGHMVEFIDQVVHFRGDQRVDADHLDRWIVRLERQRHAADQPAAAHRHQHAAHIRPVVQNFQPDRALPGQIEHASLTIDIVRAQVDRLVLVSEDDIARAMRAMLAEQGWVAEGGGVVGLAALQNGAIAPLDAAADGATVVVISGGNVDTDKLRRALCV
jgi:threonine dehydratase